MSARALPAIFKPRDGIGEERRFTRANAEARYYIPIAGIFI
jgi:hypothetical protein